MKLRSTYWKLEGAGYGLEVLEARDKFASLNDWVHIDNTPNGSTCNISGFRFPNPVYDPNVVDLVSEENLLIVITEPNGEKVVFNGEPDDVASQVRKHLKREPFPEANMGVNESTQQSNVPFRFDGYDAVADIFDSVGVAH